MAVRWSMQEHAAHSSLLTDLPECKKVFSLVCNMKGFFYLLVTLMRWKSVFSPFCSFNLIFTHEILLKVNNCRLCALHLQLMVQTVFYWRSVIKSWNAEYGLGSSLCKSASWNSQLIDLSIIWLVNWSLISDKKVIHNFVDNRLNV